jgi:hypothetical protein
MRKLLALLVGGPDRFATGASRGRRITLRGAYARPRNVVGREIVKIGALSRRSAAVHEKTQKKQHETDFVQSAKFINFGKGSMLRSKTVGRASVLASRLEACQFCQNAANDVNDAYILEISQTMIRM